MRLRSSGVINKAQRTGFVLTNFFWVFFEKVVEALEKTRDIISKDTKTAVAGVAQVSTEDLLCVTVVKHEGSLGGLADFAGGSGWCLVANAVFFRDLASDIFAVGGFLGAHGAFRTTKSVSFLVESITSGCVTVEKVELLDSVAFGALFGVEAGVFLVFFLWRGVDASGMVASVVLVFALAELGRGSSSSGSSSHFF